MIQIDMPMPERCGVCFAMRTDEIGLESWCGIDETARDIYTEEINTKRPDWCPLKENEAVEPIKPLDKDDDYTFMCSNCKGELFCGDVLRDNFCPTCGHAVKWE